MDLTRFDSLTREMLEAEARRRGIKNVEYRSRTDLVRLILRHQYGGPMEAGRDALQKGARTVKFARALVDSAVTAALAAMPEQLSLFGAGRIGRGVPERPRGPTHDRAPSSRPPRPMESAHEAVTSVGQVEAASARPAAAAAATAAPSMSPSASGVAQATTRTFEEEPIRTRSMARLLAVQGHRERALLIYEELIARDSGEEALQREAAALRRGEPVTDVELPVPSGAAHGLPDLGERLWSEGAAETGLTLHWDVSAQGQARARSVLALSDGAGELAVRLVAIRPDPDPNKVVRSEITEHGPVSARGQWTADAVRGAERCLATVGLRAGDRFVSIVHIKPATHDATA